MRRVDFDLDLGSHVTLRWIQWTPDRALNPQYERLPDVPRWGAMLRHPLPGRVGQTGEEGWCEGAITFDGEVQRELEPGRPRWQVESWEPLTLSPSVLCACGLHGWIRDGKWMSTQ